MEQTIWKHPSWKHIEVDRNAQWIDLCWTKWNQIKNAWEVKFNVQYNILRVMNWLVLNEVKPNQERVKDVGLVQQDAVHF